MLYKLLQSLVIITSNVFLVKSWDIAGTSGMAVFNYIVVSNFQSKALRGYPN